MGAQRLAFAYRLDPLDLFLRVQILPLQVLLFVFDVVLLHLQELELPLQQLVLCV